MNVCYPRNGTSCCLQGSATCCTDSSSIFFDYAPGRAVAILDSSGTPISGNTTTTTTTVTAAGGSTCPTGSPAGNNSNSNGRGNAAEIGLGVALGVVSVGAAVAITALSMKARSEMAMRRRAEATLAAARGYQLSYGPKGNDTSSSQTWSSPPVELPNRGV